MKVTNNSPNYLLPNNQLISTNSSKFVLSKDQLDQLTNQLKLLSVDDVDVKKVLKKLKNLKNKQLSLTNQAFMENNGLLGFVLSQIVNCNYDNVLSIDSKNFGWNILHPTSQFPLRFKKNKNMGRKEISKLLDTNKIIANNLKKIVNNGNLNRQQLDGVLRISNRITCTNQKLLNSQDGRGRGTLIYGGMD
uniref:Uncharacterized protein n=1 Tax=Meloidogyne enterolobii TaxID=390850 RepID=A0A6V7XQT2_MELEN|nr:unnamed protein product [Meloidogyne enterolobii]